MLLGVVVYEVSGVKSPTNFTSNQQDIDQREERPKTAYVHDESQTGNKSQGRSQRHVVRHVREQRLAGKSNQVLQVNVSQVSCHLTHWKEQLPLRNNILR